VVVLDHSAKNEPEARPYSKDDLDAARDIAPSRIKDVGQAEIEDFESGVGDEAGQRGTRVGTPGWSRMP